MTGYLTIPIIPQMVAPSSPTSSRRYDEYFSSSPPRKPGRRVDFTKMTDDERVAWVLQTEEHKRYRALHAQIASEMKAKKIGMLAQRQRVNYFHKPTEQHFEAVVVGVHLDDGPDQPYYTVRYKRPDVTDDDGTERIIFTEIDKQTTPDRLTVLPWDEDAAFAALMCTKDLAR
jgi:hypothetical protein